jgi:hypothetical protein
VLGTRFLGSLTGSMPRSEETAQGGPFSLWSLSIPMGTMVLQKMGATPFKPIPHTCNISYQSVTIHIGTYGAPMAAIRPVYTRDPLQPRLQYLASCRLQKLSNQPKTSKQNYQNTS